MTTEADEELVANERTKLTATWFNSLSVAAIAVGGFGPLVGVFTGTVAAPTAAFMATAWFAAGAALHFLARHVVVRRRA